MNSNFNIQIKKLSDNIFAVALLNDEETHSFTVEMPEEYKKFSNTSEDLIEKSFRFLLEREPVSSILREFSLSDIQKYFPEYKDEILT